jgi:hypothetical protein
MYTMFLSPSHPFAKWSAAKFERLVGHYNRVILNPLPTGVRPMQNIFYFNTDEIPDGVVTSTARLGREWYDQVEVGDTVAVYRVGTKQPVGYSVVVTKEWLSLVEVWENADHNSVGYGLPHDVAQKRVLGTLGRAYGPAMRGIEVPAKNFSVLHLLPINNPDEISEEIGDDIIAGVVEEANAAIIGLDGQVLELNKALATQGDSMLEANRRVAEVEATNRTLLDIIAQNVKEQQAKDSEDLAKARDTIHDVHAMAIGHMAAAKDGGPFVRAVTHIRRVGDLEDTTRVEF